VGILPRRGARHHRGGGDPDLAAVVAQIPWLGDWRSAGDKLRQLLQPSVLKLTVAAIRDAIRGRQGRDPMLVPIVGEPGTTAMFPDQQVKEALAARGTEGTPWRNEFAPRIALTLPSYDPGAVLARLDMPVLVCVADRDRLIPVDYARTVVARAQRAVAALPREHFELYHGPLFERVVADQTDFLRPTWALPRSEARLARGI
jgi:pimeloyl-ACP methyl ester carboxylesterase